MRLPPAHAARAIYAGKRVVGFLMYEVSGAAKKSRTALIYRFMIDHNQRGKGHGRAALAVALKEIGSISGVKKAATRTAK